MSRENVRVVQTAYRTFADSGLEAFADYWADDLEWLATRGQWRGREAGLAYMREWLDLFDDFTTEPIDVIDAGDDKVVIYLRYRGRAKGSGIEVPPEYFAIVIEVHDGKFAHALEYATREEALRAAARSE